MGSTAAAPRNLARHIGVMNRVSDQKCQDGGNQRADSGDQKAVGQRLGKSPGSEYFPVKGNGQTIITGKRFCQKAQYGKCQKGGKEVLPIR